MQTHSRWQRGVFGFVPKPKIGKRPRGAHAKCIDFHYIDEKGKRLTLAEHFTVKDFDSRTLKLMKIRQRYLHVTKGYREVAA